MEKTKKKKSLKSEKADKSERPEKPEKPENSEKPSKSGKFLVIVESPAKAKTLKKYLGKNFDVKASVGHVMDLPKSTLGVDIENGFAPTYALIKGKQKVVDDILTAASKASHIFLAADPDREGEAIAWHVADLINQPESKVKRVLFNEITKSAVLDALERPRALDRDKFESQQARRILDRLVGYKISPLLWTKVRRGLSAGRVQSVAVKMIVDREKEVLAFIPKNYWSVTASLESLSKPFPAKLFRVDQDKLERTSLDSEEWANEIVANSEKADWKILSVQKKQRKRNPDAPFITSTLQQESSKRLYFSAKKTMTLAQQLYEGIELGDLGAQGLITYMRTDSTRLSEDSVKQSRAWIERQFGKAFLSPEIIEYKNKKNAQDAHEAIRPTSAEYPPDFVKPFLDPDQFKLYDLIWKRFVACQMSQAIFDQTTIEIEAVGPNGKKYGYRATGSILRFEGFLKLWQVEEEKSDDLASELLPDVDESSKILFHKVICEKHQTQPPPRFAESSLIKDLEEKGIGRPSTYAAILTTIQDRKYVEKKENRFYPTDLGKVVTDLLVTNFSGIIDEAFTASMEDQLDQIEEGKVNWVQTLTSFYTPFEETLKIAQEKMRDVKREEIPTELNCPKCNKPLVLKWGKNGQFAACQGYPDCRFTSEFTKDVEGKVTLTVQETTDEKCVNCGKPMAVKTGRFGKFLACTAYPECKTTKPITTGIACPECKQGELSEKRTRFGKSFYSCTKYPTCKYAIWDKPLKNTTCPQCAHSFLVQHYTKKEGASIRCPNKECGFQQKVESEAEATT